MQIKPSFDNTIQLPDQLKSKRPKIRSAHENQEH
jgi:hypothetical protein